MTEKPVPAPATGVRLLRIEPERAGQRIDNFLFGVLKGVPKSHVYRLLRSGQVRVNGKRAKPDTRLAADDLLRLPPVRMAAAGEVEQAPQRQFDQIAHWVVFEDRDFLVINKPSGVASHGGSGIRFGAIELLRQWRPEQSLELVHRLDRETSGVLVLAKRRPALLAVQEQIRLGRTDKRYLALLGGEVLRASTDVNVPLAKNLLQGGERMVRVAAEGKASRSVFRVRQRFTDATLCEVELDTGRTHQIRVHAAHIGHPLLGDDKYGDPKANKRARQYGLKRLFLHATRFAFELPTAAEPYVFHAPLAADLAAALEQWR